MDFLTLAQNRFSVRSFSDKPIATETIQAILRAGQVAPTACNLQPQKILVLPIGNGTGKVSKMHRLPL